MQGLAVGILEATSATLVSISDLACGSFSPSFQKTSPPAFQLV
jgi:hypothetical protein